MGTAFCGFMNILRVNLRTTSSWGPPPQIAIFRKNLQHCIFHDSKCLFVEGAELPWPFAPSTSSRSSLSCSRSRRCLSVQRSCVSHMDVFQYSVSHTAHSSPSSSMKCKGRLAAVSDTSPSCSVQEILVVRVKLAVGACVVVKVPWRCLGPPLAALRQLCDSLWRLGCPEETDHADVLPGAAFVWFHDYFHRESEKLL